MTDGVAVTREGGRWLWLAYGYAVLVAAGLGYFLMRVPIQVTDCFTNMLALGRPYAELLQAGFQQGYLRPGLWAELKVVYDLSGGNYFYWFRLTQVLQAGVLVLMFVHLARPRSVVAFLALPLSLAVLIGSHTFAWTLREAFPINTFLTIVLCCAAAAVLAVARYRWWNDVLAVALFVVAILTVESGVLTGVILVGGYLIGLRGVSRRAVIGLCVAFALYLAARFLIFDVGTPSLLEREAGYGFRRYSGVQLNEMFGQNPLGFYAYNVATSILTVLFAEPRDGVWRTTYGALQGDAHPALLVNVIASFLATCLIGRFIWKRRHAWLRREFERNDQLVALFVLVLGANAVLSYSYTKDVIVSPAGLFMALAVFAASSDYLADFRARKASAIPAIVLLTLLSTTWAVRAVGIHAALAETAINYREQWAYFDGHIGAWGLDGNDPAAVALKQQLQDDAVLRHPVHPPIREQFTWLFDTD